MRVRCAAGNVPDAVTYTALIDACGRASHLDQAFTLFARCALTRTPAQNFDGMLTALVEPLVAGGLVARRGAVREELAIVTRATTSERADHGARPARTRIRRRRYSKSYSFGACNGRYSYRALARCICIATARYSTTADTAIQQLQDTARYTLPLFAVQVGSTWPARRTMILARVPLGSDTPPQPTDNAKQLGLQIIFNEIHHT